MSGCLLEFDEVVRIFDRVADNQITAEVPEESYSKAIRSTRLVAGK
jgi:hypothetical protein